jgi:hypothetical protein
MQIVNLWSQQLEQVNKEVRIASCLPGLSDSDLTVLTWGFGNVVWYGGYCEAPQPRRTIVPLTLRLQAVSTAAFYPQEVRHDCMPSNITSVWLLTSTKLTVLPHRSLPEPKMLDHDLGKPETTSSHHSGSLTSL